NVDVNAAVHDVERIDHQSGSDGGAAKAAARLNQEYNDVVKAQGQAAGTQFLSDATKQLQADGVLPDVTLGVLNGEFGRLTQTDKITKNALNFDNNITFKDAQQGAFDSQFVSLLTQNDGALFNQLVGSVKGKDGAITQDNLSKYFANQDKDNQKSG